jgi:formylglycine-generating enzyme required for sulfatase activity
VIKENLPVQFCFRDTHSLTVSPRHSHGDDAENFQWSLENFSKEAAMLASLDHPGIVRVHRSFQAFGTAYFVMPFVEGMALDELEKEREGKPFSEDELRGLLERVLDALGYLHDRGIYHRDLKPGNLLITHEGIPVLIDFGSARQRLSERSMTVVESPGYTPFEQLQTRGNVGPWSDLYALGATLVKLMTGEAPPKTNDRSFGDPWRPLLDRADLAGKFSVGFLKGIDRSLKLQIEERWQNAGEWRAALRGETVALPVADMPEYVPVTASAAVASAPITGSQKRTNFVPWAVAACMVLGLIALGKSVSNERAEVAAQARDAEQRAAQAEREKEAFIAQAKVKEEAAAQAAEKQRSALAEQEKQALIAQAKAKEEAEAKAAEKQRAAQAEQEKQVIIEQSKAKEEAEAKAAMEKRSLPGSKAGEEREFEIAPGVKITMCWIPPGEFVMGSLAPPPHDTPRYLRHGGELGRVDDEVQHRVRITKGFWLEKYEVTQAQWRAVMGNDPSHFKGDDLPVESVSWNDIAGSGGFLEKVNGFAGGQNSFCLPTEAQWEYACRAGTIGAHSGNLDQIAWYADNAGSKTHPVGRKKANAWGLHDMQGNVQEWSADWYGSYPTSAASDPGGSTSGSGRVHRGGGWDNSVSYCRVAFRCNSYPASGDSRVGFRLARSSAPQSGR